MDFEASVKEIEKKIGYTFKDKSLLRQAFTRTSYTNEHKDRHGKKYQSNEVLEFFGDSILSAAIVTLLMKSSAERYEHGITTSLDEGDFSNVKSKLSDKKNLSDAILRLGIAKHLLMGEGDAKLGIDNEPSVMEDLFESIIGAIYIDSDHNIGAVIGVVAKLLDVKEYLKSNTAPMQSFKNALQEWCADKKHRREAPVYKTVSETGPDHKKIYERACYIGDKVYGIGMGKNQKLADAAAAEEALASLIKEENARVAKESAEASANSVRKLRELCAREKKTSPEFRDLGESSRSTSALREYEVECRCMGLSAIGRSGEKCGAKAEAANAVLKLIENETRKDKTMQKTKNVIAKKVKKSAHVSKNSAPLKNANGKEGMSIEPLAKREKKHKKTD